MNNTLPEKIIEEIKKQGIEPRPRWQFLLKRWALWGFAVFSTILGGVAIAIIIFIFIDHDASARIYLEQSALEDILLTIPYFWLVTLVVLIGMAKYAVHHTRFGYRYATVKIVGLVLIGSVLFGVALNVVDVGQSVQNLLAEKIPYYDAITHTSKDVWSHPEKGLLGGTIIAVTSPKEFKLLDFHKKDWLVDTSEVDSDQNVVPQQGTMIRVIGVQKEGNIFSAQQILSWDK